MPGAPQGRGVVAVAVSGGRDSTALLHAVASAARGTALEVLALHVHHGLQAEADAWVSHLQTQCRRWRRRLHSGLRLEIRRLAGSPAQGESIEAWARRERHAALADMAKAGGASLLLLAHHRRDQAETVLLQSLRGGTLASTSAMPAAAERGGVVWARPWLGIPSVALDAYVRRHRLKHIIDPSNAETRLDRNRLRAMVWPALVAAFPHAEAGLAGAALQAQSARALIDEVAGLDLSAVSSAEGQLIVSDWLHFSEARRRFALAAWLVRVLGRAAPESLLGRLLKELPEVRVGAWPLPAREGEAHPTLRLYRGLLAPAHAPTQGVAGGAPEVSAALEALGVHSAPDGAVLSVPLSIAAAERMAVPEFFGTLCLRRVDAGGIADERLRGASLRLRQGGERFQAAAQRPPRALKLQFQAAGVPAWARSAPLLVSAAGPESMVLFVPGLGVDARALAPPGAPQWLPVWEPLHSTMPEPDPRRPSR